MKASHSPSIPPSIPIREWILKKFTFTFYFSSLPLLITFAFLAAHVIELFCISPNNNNNLLHHSSRYWCIVRLLRTNTHTQIFDVFGSVGNEVLHNLYCRIKDSRHDELCNSCGIHKKQCRMCNCCCCFIISWMMVAKKKWEQKKVLFPPMQIHIHTSQLHYFSISLFKAKNCVKSRLSFYLYVHTHFNDCNCLPFRWIFLISFTHSSRRYFSSFIINLWFEANWNVDASFNQRFDATSVFVAEKIAVN